MLPDSQCRGLDTQMYILQTDSTIAPPRNQRFALTNVSRLLNTRKDVMKKLSPSIFLIAKEPSHDDVGVAGKGHRTSEDTTCSWCQSWPLR